MRRRLISLASLAAFIATGADAETCEFPAGETLWASISQNIDDSCTEDGTATFVCGTGDRVRITANIDGTTGKFEKTDGCYVSVDPGVTVRFGGRSEATGATGTLSLRGSVLATSRIVSIDRTSTTRMNVELEGDYSATTNPATDYLVIWDEDPIDPDETLNGRTVQIGPGIPQPGDYMPSPGKWKWYKFIAEAGSVLTVITDEYTDARGLNMGDGYDPNAYTGVHTMGLVTPTALTSITPNQYGHTTTLLIPDRDDAIVLDRGDLTDQYVEIVTGPCSGYEAKILDSVNNGIGADATIVVAGDLTYMPAGGSDDLDADDDVRSVGDTDGFLACGATPSVVIHYGERAGQIVKVVRPVIWDGYDGAGGATTDDTGTLNLANGTIEAEWVRFVRFSYADYAADFAPDNRRNCTLCMVLENGTAQLHGYLRNFDLGYMKVAAGDTTGLGFSSLQSAEVPRFAGVTADFSDFQVRRGYVHDQTNSAPTAGIHGIYVDDATGLDLRQIRVERIGDDMYGDQLTTVGGTLSPHVSLRHFVGLAQMPGTTTSAQGFEPTVSIYGDGDDAEIVRLANHETYQDIFVVGGADNSCFTAGLQSVKRIVCAGGTKNGGVGLGVLPSTARESSSCKAGIGISCCSGTGTGTCAMSSDIRETIGSTVEDAYINTIGPGTGLGRFFSFSNLKNSIVQLTGNDASAYGIYTDLDGVMWYNSGTATGLVSFYANTSNAGRQGKSAWNINSSVVMGAGATFFAMYVPDYGLATSVNFTRLYAGVNDIAGSHGYFIHLNDVAGKPVTFTIDGMNLAATTPDTNSIGTGEPSVAAGSAFQHICAESIGVRTANETFGPTPDPTNLHVSDVGPGPADPAVLADFLAPVEGDGDPCLSYRPNRLGIQNVGVEWPLLGDFAVAQFDRWSSNTDLIRVRVGRPPACGDGFDNDGDGLVDYPADPGCLNAASVRENPQCQDGLNNDHQTGIDFDGGASVNDGVPLAEPDAECLSKPWKDREVGACGLGAELALLLAPLLWAHRRRRAN